MNNLEFENWKLKEIAQDIEVIALDSIQYKKKLLADLALPLSENNNEINRSETDINWLKFPQYYKFFFDKEGWENRIQEWFKTSKLSEVEKILITYGWEEPMIKVPTKLFLEDWEGFLRSTLWETIIFSEDFSLIMEVSRDYYLHSNFEIMPNSKVV
jgi:hypothetical protein